MHIPKAAGISFRKNLKDHLPDGTDVVSTEGCFADGAKMGRKVVTILRHPRSHVLSQYMHCSTSGDHTYAAFRMPPTFEEWVNAWYDLRQQKKKAAFCCFNPVDMQSYRFVCPAESCSASDFQNRLFSEVDQDLALKNLRAADFVGVVEAYQESLCVFHAKALNALPEYCNCEDKDAWSKFPGLQEITHGVASHSVDEYSEETLNKVDALTAVDNVLYAEAVSRFKEEVEGVEATFGKKILCHDLTSMLPVDVADTNELSLHATGTRNCRPDD